MAKMKKVTLDELETLAIMTEAVRQKAEGLHARASRGYLETQIDSRVERAYALQAAAAALSTMGLFLLMNEFEARTLGRAGPSQGALQLPPLRRRA